MTRSDNEGWAARAGEALVGNYGSPAITLARGAGCEL